MDLILWRHAEAVDGLPDAGRRLTEKGHKQAQQMAAWLQQHLPEERTRILVSPATRAQQTAQAMGVEYETSTQLGLSASPVSILTAAAWPDVHGAVLVVGHQPTLGRLAAFLLCGEEQEWSVKKGALWWISNRVRQGEGQTVLRCVLAPEMI
jgi:phosphohistidine phosphatase